MNKAVFFDRDGVINKDLGYVHEIKDFIWIEGIFNLFKWLENEGFLIIIVTNQSGIGRGFYTEEKFQHLNKWILNTIKKNNCTINKIYHCPHLPSDNCSCRKPKPGMIIKAIKEFNINPKSSWLIGDKISDIEAAKNANIPNTIYFNKTQQSTINSYHIKSLNEVKLIIKKYNC
ncbi:D-glycero-beta-D-manno-heptose-1,7-bisphosphate 7-phosphatase [Candidatus Marinamargulisbacteria bacterium SCGC AG-410-N11]|nr:D-glycero-beta-D-manno-heptose-1,7-bisphosphate 7-phosphatase [Candidatus Marinamargulisbacteria bacterium SCGC AG-410-N11]